MEKAQILGYQEENQTTRGLGHSKNNVTAAKGKKRCFLCMDEQKRDSKAKRQQYSPLTRPEKGKGYYPEGRQSPTNSEE